MTTEQKAEVYAADKGIRSAYVPNAEVLKAWAKMDYIAGNKEAGGMKFIKCSDRLPQYKKKCNGRLKGEPALIHDSKLANGYVTANGNLERIEDVEWLDEAPSNAETEKDKRIAGLEHEIERQQVEVDELKEVLEQHMIQQVEPGFWVTSVERQTKEVQCPNCHYYLPVEFP